MEKEKDLSNSPLDLERQLELARQLFQMNLHRAGSQTLEQVKVSSLVALAETLLTGVGCLARMDRRLAYIQLHLSALQRLLQPPDSLHRETAKATERGAPEAAGAPQPCVKPEEE